MKLPGYIRSGFWAVTTVVLFSFSSDTNAQDNQTLDSAAIYSMSLEDLLKIKSSGVSSELEKLINSLLDVASKKPLSTRKSPNIVTLITQEEIEKSGAHDLIDVLRLVPGMDFGSDVQGVVGMGIRGNWAHEGKVLLLIDGQEMNEILYSSLQFGNHFDVSQIKKIEIIRGPGSAIYGGFAEYGVISIVTKNGEDLNGVSANVNYGQMQDAFARRNVTLSVGKKINDFQFSLAGFTGQGNRSNRDFVDFKGKSFNMTGNSDLDPTNVNAGLMYKNLSFRAIWDQYNTTSRDNYGEIVSKAYPSNFKSYFLELKYDYKPNQKFTITPKFNYKKQLPWNFNGTTEPDDSSYTVYDKQAERYRGNITASYDLTKKINVLAGGEMFYDIAKIGVDPDPFSNGKNQVSYLNTAAFTQSIVKNHIVNFVVGARLDHNSAYGSAFVPRLGLTKKMDKLNLKLLYSNSFRAPGIENINSSYDGTIKPEKTTVLELEVSYQLRSNMFFTANIFDITTKDPIIYFVDPAATTTNVDGYKNIGQLGSQGVELEYKIKDKWGYVNLNYSFYTTQNKQRVEDYEIPGKTNQVLAFPSHKINLNSSFDLARKNKNKFGISPSLSWISTRYGYTFVDNMSGEPIIKEFSPVLLANLFFYGDFSGGFKAGIGCYNIFDQKIDFIQPYNGGHAPLPGVSREFIIKLSYTFSFKNKEHKE